MPTILSFVRSIRFRLALWFVVALAIVIAIVSALLYMGLRQGLVNGLDRTLRDAARRSVEIPAENAAADTPDLARSLLLIRNAPVRLLSINGETLQSDPAFPPALALTDAMIASALRGEETFETAGNIRVFTAPVRVNGKRVAIVQTAASLDDVNATLSTVRSLLLVLLPAALALSGLGGLLFASQALAPMERVRRDVERIEATDLSQRVSAGLANDEIGALAHTFDGMLDRMQRAMSRERQFTSDASHELRSPLTVIKAEVSAALARPRTIEFYQRTLAELDALTDELNTLVEDLLTLARASSHAPRQEPVDLTALGLRVGQRMRAIAQTRGLTLNLPDSGQAPIMVKGDALKLQRVITNLMDNALRYTASGAVTLRVSQTGQRATVEVEDSGVGIAPEHVSHVFERFYRADNDRGRETGGTGLGLSIAKAIVEAHGGEISVRSTVGVGTTFSFWLPAA